MRAGWLAVLFVMVALSGCTDGDGPSSDGSDDPPATGGDTNPTETEGNQDPGNGGNTTDPDEGNDDPDEVDPPGPSVGFSVNVNEGPPPLDVTFTLTFSGLDGHSITYQVLDDIGGTEIGTGEVTQDGTVDIAHTYEEEDEYLAAAIFEVDGEGAIERTLTITVQPLAVPQQAFGSITTGIEGCALPTVYETAGLVPGVGTIPDGSIRGVVAIDVATAGQTFRVEWTFDTGYLYGGLFFTDDSGSIVQSHVQGGQNFGGYSESGSVPAGATYLILHACGGPLQLDWTYQTPIF